MLSSRPLPSRTSRWVITAALAAVAVVPFAASAASTAGGCAVTPDKCYSFTMSASPSTPNTGQLATYTGTLTNLSRSATGLQLGSADVTLPADFYDTAAGSVSQGTETLSAGVIALRNLNDPPGGSVTFTFQARADKGGTYSFPSEAKQANNFSGTGNDLTLSGSDPTVTVSSFCSSGVSGYNAYGCSIISIANGGTTSTSGVDSSGNPSKVNAAITYKPIAGATGTFASELRTDLGTNQCPIAVGGPCDFVVSVQNKIPTDYTISRDAITLLIDCKALCTGTPRGFFAYNDATGVQEPLLPCTPLSGTVASPVSGSYACIDDNGNGTYTVRHLTNVDDYKVMSYTLL